MARQHQTNSLKKSKNSPIILLAPSKTLDLAPLPKLARPVKPVLFGFQAADIMRSLKQLSIEQLEKLMAVSPEIARQVKKWNSDWSTNIPGRPALWTYAGDVYKGMYARELSSRNQQWAEEHLLILSGLYGLLRPFDGIQPYRLEMRTKLPIGETDDLYSFWGTSLAEQVEEFLPTDGWLCNLSSDEYARPVIRQLSSEISVITPCFHDKKSNGTIGSVPIYSKMMRGVLAHFMIEHEVNHSKELEKFHEHGYHYDAARSTPDGPVFYRESMRPLVFAH